MTKQIATGSVRWIHEAMADGAVTFRRGKCGDRMIAEWPGTATLTCARDGSRVALIPAAGVSRNAAKRCCGVPMSALLHDLSGQLALHASAVAMGGRAIVFLGEGGAGKSTAAAELCFHHGARILADDVALLETGSSGVDVLPSQRRHWLSPESCAALGVGDPRADAWGEKRSLRSPDAPNTRYPLALVVALGFASPVLQVAPRPLSGADRARLLLAAAIRFDLEDASARRRELDQLTTLSRHALFLELVRSPDAPGKIAPFVLTALAKTRS